MSLVNWALAVITTSNLVGRLEVAAGNTKLSPDDEQRQAWEDARQRLHLDDGFDAWYGRVACDALDKGITVAGSKRLTPFARELIDFAGQRTHSEEQAVTLAQYGELLEPHVERFVRESLGGPVAPATPAGEGSVWDELLDPAALEAADRDFGLRLGRGTARERFKKLLTPGCLEQIEKNDFEPVSKNVALLWKPAGREKLAAALGCGEGQLVGRLLQWARQGRTQGRKTADLLGAEQMKIMIVDLIRATSDAVLSILSQARASDLGDRETIDCILAGLLALRHNYREAVEPLLGAPDVRGQYSAEFLDKMWDLLKALNSSRLEKAGIQPDPFDLDGLSPLTRQLALVLEAVQFNPFGTDDSIDLTGASLLNDPDRRQVLLPLGEGEGTREPLSRDEFVERLRETLGKEGTLLEV